MAKPIRVKGKLVPAALVAALTGGGALSALEQLEGNVLRVYADAIAGGLPTRCAGDTNHSMPVGTRLTDDECREVNKGTLISYGSAVLACTTWEHLDGDRLVGLTLFAINVGKSAACGSESFKAINAGRIQEGCNLLATQPNGKPNWSSSGGKYIPGLQNRRQAEKRWCLKGLGA